MNTMRVASNGTMLNCEIDGKDGAPWLKAGETAPDGDLAGMNFYVEGVEGALPK